MTIGSLIIGTFLALSAAATVLLLLVLAGARRLRVREAYHRIAADHGWTYAFHPQDERHSCRHEFRHPVEGWCLTLQDRRDARRGRASRRLGKATGRAAVSRVGPCAEFIDPRPLIPVGLAVLGPALSNGDGSAEDAWTEGSEDAGRTRVERLAGNLGRDRHLLRSVDDQPGPGQLLATPGAENALDDIRGAPELGLAQPDRVAPQPVVMRGAFGMRLRLGRPLRGQTEIEEFVSLGKRLSGNLHVC
ncbi:hypothetical protein [Psychromarinibacter halotolerans]|uniref:Secreted protein n=1 Tax=Psychromarinibacter halotolerans TaxID=1775175 RepID=A0ABV7GVL5_9RHOB|nr:hypothetical protein [Psychromarinibacter halotolerans]MAQ85084.1 hypothetical protein [Maritimibacter sp.]MDF0597426.1 hypothetical protein [Psychromarinibacter halotolerans]